MIFLMLMKKPDGGFQMVLESNMRSFIFSLIISLCLATSIVCRKKSTEEEELWRFITDEQGVAMLSSVLNSPRAITE